jgi:hypothetical protein
VWNETQRREAVDVHKVPKDRVFVTGAQCFDHWFDRKPSRTQQELCVRLGLPRIGPSCSTSARTHRGQPARAAVRPPVADAVARQPRPTVATAAVLVRRIQVRCSSGMMST